MSKAKVKATNYFVETSGKDPINSKQLQEYLDFMDAEGFDLIKLMATERHFNDDAAKFQFVWKLRKQIKKPKPKLGDEFEPD